MPPKYYRKKSTNTQLTNSNTLNHADYLVIVESPSKCAKIEHYLGVNYCCIASKGHLRQIEGLKSIDTKNSFSPTFTILPEKKEHITKMKSIISKFSSSHIYLATDDDREGEAIAWHICQLFDLPLTTPRIIFHEITKTAIINAVANPTTINMSLVNAQQARQVLDVIVGYKISPFLWKYLYNNKDNSLSAGRCQTPALKLIYENEKERENQKLTKQYKTIGDFTDKRISFSLKNDFVDEIKLNVFLKNSINFAHKISLGSQKVISKSPPKPFHTSRLLQTASNQLHMSPKETMSLCQQLYQGGYITYMRTESDLYSKDFVDKMTLYITKQFNSPDYLGDTSRLMNTNSENPHEAIRVTQIELKTIPNCENNRMNTLYKLIWRTTIESCMTSATYNQTKVLVSAPDNNEYYTDIEIPKFLGWTIVESKTDLTEQQSVGTSLLLYIKSLINNDNIPYNAITSTLSVHSNHSYYTEAGLVNKLESLGIGRPSTYSTIIETIKERGYVKKMDTSGHTIECCDYILKGSQIQRKNHEKTFGVEKNKLIIQSIGLVALEFLTKYFDKLFSYDYTKNMEELLDLISTNTITEWNTICKDCYQQINALSPKLKDVNKKAYEIKTGYEFIFEKYGPVIRYTNENNEIEYLPGNKEIDIDIEKLENKAYSLKDLMMPGSQILGTYRGEEIQIKNGKYGYYVEWGNNRESLKTIGIPITDITIEKITEFLDKKPKKGVDVLRELNDVMAVRKGKYGAYVFYKRPDMKKPQFLDIKKCPHGFLNCEVETLVDWLCKEYNLPLP